MRHGRAAGGLLLWCFAAGLHAWLEQSMLRHMLLQLPLIVIGGWLLGSTQRPTRAMHAVDQHGLAVLSAMLFAGAYWMIPRALELSLSDDLVQTAKFVSLGGIGLLLPGAFARASAVVQLFFVGNACAMTAAAGMLYQELPQRLCNAYLRDDQDLTGQALVGMAAALAVLWCVHQVRSGALADVRQDGAV